LLKSFYECIVDNGIISTSHRDLVVSITDYELGGLGSNPSRGIAGFFDSDRPLPRVGVLWTQWGGKTEIHPLLDATVRVLAHRFLKNGRCRPTPQVYIVPGLG
jgi:hypothetical protein